MATGLGTHSQMVKHQWPCGPLNVMKTQLWGRRSWPGYDCPPSSGECFRRCPTWGLVGRGGRRGGRRCPWRSWMLRVAARSHRATRAANARARQLPAVHHLIGGLLGPAQDLAEYRVLIDRGLGQRLVAEDADRFALVQDPLRAGPQQVLHAHLPFLDA